MTISMELAADRAPRHSVERLVRRFKAHNPNSQISGPLSHPLAATAGLATAKTSKPRMSRIARINNICVIREIRGQKTSLPQPNARLTPNDKLRDEPSMSDSRPAKPSVSDLLSRRKG